MTPWIVLAAISFLILMIGFFVACLYALGAMRPSNPDDHADHWQEDD